MPLLEQLETDADNARLGRGGEHVDREDAGLHRRLVPLGRPDRSRELDGALRRKGVRGNEFVERLLADGPHACQLLADAADRLVQLDELLVGGGELELVDVLTVYRRREASEVELERGQWLRHPEQASVDLVELVASESEVAGGGLEAHLRSPTLALPLLDLSSLLVERPLGLRCRSLVAHELAPCLPQRLELIDIAGDDRVEAEDGVGLAQQRVAGVRKLRRPALARQPSSARSRRSRRPRPAERRARSSRPKPTRRRSSRRRRVRGGWGCPARRGRACPRRCPSRRCQGTSRCRPWSGGPR